MEAFHGKKIVGGKKIGSSVETLGKDQKGGKSQEGKRDAKSPFIVL